MNKDRVSKEVRSRIMSKIRSKDTKPELKVKDALNALPWKFYYHLKAAPFHPEFIIEGKKITIFVDGDFWHGHLPIPLDPFWVQKITRNMMREREANEYYVKEGWAVLRILESHLNKLSEERLKYLLHTFIDRIAIEPGVTRI